VNTRRMLFLLALLAAVATFAGAMIWRGESWAPGGDASENAFIFAAESVYAAGARNLYYEERLAEIQAGGALTVFVPLIVTDTATQVITLPLTSRVISSWGYTHEEALGGNFFGQMLDRLAVSIIPAESGQYYILGRTFLEVTVPELPPEAEITGAHLVLDLCGSAREMPPVLMVANPGTWSGAAPEDGELWHSFEEPVVAAFSVADTSCQQTQVWRIPFDPDFFTPGQTVRLVLRDHEDAVDLRPVYSSPAAVRRLLSYPHSGSQQWEFTIGLDFPVE
jgi:hypothetical protein